MAGGVRCQSFWAFGCLILSAGFATALVWQSARGTVVPYFVEIDRHGETCAVEAANAGYRPSDPQIAWHLARFIEEVRGLPVDPSSSGRTGSAPMNSPPTAALWR